MNIGPFFWGFGIWPSDQFCALLAPGFFITQPQQADQGEQAGDGGQGSFGVEEGGLGGVDKAG